MEQLQHRARQQTQVWVTANTDLKTSEQNIKVKDWLGFPLTYWFTSPIICQRLKLMAHLCPCREMFPNTEHEIQIILLWFKLYTVVLWGRVWTKCSGQSAMYPSMTGQVWDILLMMMTLTSRKCFRLDCVEEGLYRSRHKTHTSVPPCRVLVMGLDEALLGRSCCTGCLWRDRLGQAQSQQYHSHSGPERSSAALPPPNPHTLTYPHVYRWDERGETWSGECRFVNWSLHGTSSVLMPLETRQNDWIQWHSPTRQENYRLEKKPTEWEGTSLFLRKW